MIDDDENEDRQSEISEEFNEAKTVRPCSEWEKKKLLEQAETPRLERHLTPGGEVEEVVHRGISEANRKRIKEIEERLRNVRLEKNTTRDFGKNKDR